MTPANKDTRPLPYLAAMLAWLIPGAGHLYIGRPARGAIIFLTIAATFWTGLALGGVMTVDYHNKRWWFAAEMCTGIHGLISWYRQDAVYKKLQDDMLDDQQFQNQLESCTSQAGLFLLRRTYMDKIMQANGVALVAPTETIARAYAGVAGLLNVMCIFDALILSVMGLRGEAGGNRKHESGTA